VKLTDNAKDFIAEKGFDSNFGARPLKRAIQKYLEDPIAEEILKGEIHDGDILEIDYDKEGDKIVVDNRSPGKKKKKEEGSIE
jgi:ATP-dependent Clp protease ATP-binding subunit ClpC